MERQREDKQTHQEEEKWKDAEISGTVREK
jgi:hypothetical protein